MGVLGCSAHQTASEPNVSNTDSHEETKLPVQPSGRASSSAQSPRDPDAANRATEDEPRPIDAEPHDADEIPPDGDASSPADLGNEALEVGAQRHFTSRLVAFFRAGFRCPPLPDGVAGGRATALFTMRDDGTVVSFTLTPSSIPDLDAAARATAQSRVGQQVPPYPPAHPEVQQTTLSVSYACR